MRILLRVLVVLLFLLSGLSLFLGHRLFEQREQMKARVHVLEQAVHSLSKQVEYEQSNDLEMRRLPAGNFDIQSLKKYYAIDPQTGKPRVERDPRTFKMVKVTTGRDTMAAVLDELQGNARRQTQRLDDTRVSLRETRIRLEETQDKLGKTKAELTSAYDKIDTKSDEIGQLKEENTSLNNTIDTHKEQIATLNTTIDDQKGKMAKQEERIFEMNTTVASLQKRINELQIELQRIKATGVIATIIPRGRHGTVLKVDPEWNQLILRTNADTPLTPGVTLVVRRDQTFIGKVKLVTVKKEDSVAVAEVLLPWLQKPIQKGDTLDYAGD